MRRFWSWVRDEPAPDPSSPTEGAGSAPSPDALRIEGEIVSSAWWDDETAPRDFRAQLDGHPGPVTVWINSPGGDVFAASAIYTALMEHGDITVKIDGLAASAASLIAMAGDQVLMSPTAMMMIHEPWTIAMGDETEMRKAQEQLIQVREGMLSAYERKTRRTRADIMTLLKAETWMSAEWAVDNRFADGILYHGNKQSGRPAALVDANIARAFSGGRTPTDSERAEREAVARAAENIKLQIRRTRS